MQRREKPKIVYKNMLLKLCHRISELLVHVHAKIKHGQNWAYKPNHVTRIIP